MFFVKCAWAAGLRRVKEDDASDDECGDDQCFPEAEHGSKLQEPCGFPADVKVAREQAWVRASCSSVLEAQLIGLVVVERVGEKVVMTALDYQATTAKDERYPPNIGDSKALRCETCDASNYEYPCAGVRVPPNSLTPLTLSAQASPASAFRPLREPDLPASVPHRLLGQRFRR